RTADPRLPRAAQERRTRPHRRAGDRAGRGGRSMSVLVVGLSHRSAPVEVLEQVTLDADAVGKVLDDVRGSAHVSEAAIVSTCNRLELYADVTTFHGGVADISTTIATHTGSGPEVLSPHLYVHYDERAV